jgi:hypothetical protein
MCGAPEHLPAFGAHSFSTVITTSVVQALNEKVAGVDCMMRWLYVARIVAAPIILLKQKRDCKCKIMYYIIGKNRKNLNLI